MKIKKIKLSQNTKEKIDKINIVENELNNKANKIDTIKTITSTDGVVNVVETITPDGKSIEITKGQVIIDIEDKAQETQDSVNEILESLSNQEKTNTYKCIISFIRTLPTPYTFKTKNINKLDNLTMSLPGTWDIAPPLGTNILGFCRDDDSFTPNEAPFCTNMVNNLTKKLSTLFHSINISTNEVLLSEIEITDWQNETSVILNLQYWAYLIAGSAFLNDPNGLTSQVVTGSGMPVSLAQFNNWTNINLTENPNSIRNKYFTINRTFTARNEEIFRIKTINPNKREIIIKEVETPDGTVKVQIYWLVSSNISGEDAIFFFINKIELFNVNDVKFVKEENPISTKVSTYNDLANNNLPSKAQIEQRVAPVETKADNAQTSADNAQTSANNAQATADNAMKKDGTNQSIASGTSDLNNVVSVNNGVLVRGALPAFGDVWAINTSTGIIFIPLKNGYRTYTDSKIDGLLNALTIINKSYITPDGRYGYYFGLDGNFYIQDNVYNEEMSLSAEGLYISNGGVNSAYYSADFFNRMLAVETASVEKSFSGLRSPTSWLNNNATDTPIFQAFSGSANSQPRDITAQFSTLINTDYMSFSNNIIRVKSGITKKLLINWELLFSGLFAGSNERRFTAYLVRADKTPTGTPEQVFADADVYGIIDIFSGLEASLSSFNDYGINRFTIRKEAGVDIVAQTIGFKIWLKPAYTYSQTTWITVTKIKSNIDVV